MSETPQIAGILADLEAKVREAYNLGHKAGRRDERERIERMLRSTGDEMPTPRSASEAMPDVAAHPARAGRGASGAGGRVAPGTIRPLVQKIVETEPGLIKAEITRRVISLNADIAPSSISNELQRNEKSEKKGLRIYRRTRGRWYPHNEADLPNETAGIAEDDHPPELAASTGNGHDRTTMNHSGSA